eukprot:CAMPEP_0197657768 /NCGR_PEP_ID=MMETSP1338-20131121/44833_1 /TAXON_ID=43686 ORGANISM="Pelagodinium beii, Strain RCC1491" /NCGR_SAMPLE_ID=MMETSP1338 /ASSEMBLY_ACC=CAM_ASM_000754 /LENGTH=253 /DNA_ID=CAMNT_0043234217 /DNA_START=222 /DNA_END=980 /DNA_ORIENTATION=-
MNLKALIRKAKDEPGGTAPNRPGATNGYSSRADDPKALTLSESKGMSKEQELELAQDLPVMSPTSTVKAAPPSVMLMEEWLPPEAEAVLLGNLQARHADFVQLRGKRTAMYGGKPGPSFEPEALPSWLQKLCESVSASSAMEEVPNHVLVNQYQAGEGIMPHTDGPAYLPRAAILSLGSAVVFEFWRDHAHAKTGESPVSLLLPPRSLLVFEAEAYTSHLHGIADRRFDELQGVANWTAEAQSRYQGPDAPDW